jgi:hypothetical protein
MAAATTALNPLLEHFTHYEKVYNGIGQLCVVLAFLTTCAALYLSWCALVESRRGAHIAQEPLRQQIEWQQRTTEKQIYYQIVQSEWSQEWQTWHEAVHNPPPGSKPLAQPRDLRERLLEAGVLKREAK